MAKRDLAEGDSAKAKKPSTIKGSHEAANGSEVRGTTDWKFDPPDRGEVQIHPRVDTQGLEKIEPISCA